MHTPLHARTLLLRLSLAVTDSSCRCRSRLSAPGARPKHGLGGGKHSGSHRAAHTQAHAARALGLNESQTAASHKACPAPCAGQSTRGRAQSGQIGPAAAPCGREDGRGTAAASELQCSSSVGGPRPKARPIPCDPTASARRAAAPSRAPCRRPHAPGPWHGRGRKRAISRSKSGPRRNARERTGCGPRRLARRPAHAHADDLRAYLAWNPRRSRALQIRVRPLP